MVLLHMKRSETDQFLFDTTVEASIKEVIAALVEVHNLRHKISRLKYECAELAKHGPAKPVEQQGIDEFSETPVSKGPHYLMDPTGRRTGNACDPETANVLLKALDEADAVASKDQVARKVSLTATMLKDALDNIRGAVMICYPMGLPAWDMVRQELEDSQDLAGTSYAADELEQDSSTLWFAGKQMLSDKPLKEYVGRHEKTRAVVKLQRKGQGAPAREPVVDQDTQKAMMAWYYKKQEEQKKLVENEDDSYTAAQWAAGTSLKAHLSGVSSVRVPR